MKRNVISSTIIIILMVIYFPGCNPMENATTSGSRMVVEFITGPDIEGDAGSITIFSDVLTSSNSIFNDDGQAQIKAVLLDPFAGDATQYQTITIDRIFIKFSRTDGLNVEGRDVPFSFSQDVNVLINIEQSVEFPFVLVPHTAKVESPLVDLRWVNEILKIEAEITFYGKDGAGRRVQEVTGSVSIWFGNFADTN